MKKIYLLTCLFVISISCQKEEIISPITDSSFSDQEPEAIAFDNLPANIKDNFDNTNHIKFKSRNVKSKNPFGTAKTNSQVIKNINKKGLASYTIALNKINSTIKSELKNLLYFDNLSITDLGNGELVKYIFRYIPDKNWCDMGKQMSTYTGEIEIYNLSGTKLSDMTLVQGNQIAKDHLKLNDELICMYEFVSMTCTELIMEGDTSSTEICHFTYELDYCTSGSGSSGGSTVNTNTYQGSTWNGEYTTGGTPGTIPDDTEIIDTTPILLDGDQDTFFDLYNIDSDSLTGKEKCLNDLLDKEGNSFVYELLKNFRGDSEFDIEIESKDNLYGSKGDPVNGLTFEPLNNIINIQISTNAATSRPALGVVRTILHEYIHADMFRKLNTVVDNQTTDILNFKDTYESFKNDNFEADPQHETMAALYIDEMTKTLKNFHEYILVKDYNYLTDNGANPLPDSFYEALAWQGLTEEGEVVDAYNQLSDEKKAELQESLSLYYPSTTTNCPENN